MTADLFKFKEEDLIFVDIETVSGSEKLEPNSEEFNLFQWKKRDRENWDALPTVPETLLAYQQSAALDAVYAKIVCISVGAIHNGKIIVRSYSGEEKDILRQFVDMVNSTNGKTLVLWNASFDMPTIRKRFFINKLTGYLRDSVGNDSMKKPWTLKGILDMMDVWKGISYYNSSLEEVAWVMGLPSPKSDIKGSEVTGAYYRGEIDRIVSYCERDVATLINLWRIFTEREVISEVIVKTDQPIKGTTDAPKISLAQELFNKGAVTPEYVGALMEISKKLTTAQRPKFVNLLNAINGKEIDKGLATMILKPPRKTRTPKPKAMSAEKVVKAKPGRKKKAVTA